MTTERKVIVAGVQGVIGRAAAQRLAAEPETTVYGLSRRSGDLVGVQHISVDLLQPDDVKAKLGSIGDVTHIVFGAYIEKPTAAEKSAVNFAILRNLLDVVEATSPGLEHITFYQGGKAYGADLGPFKTPAREDDPRLMPPNFYYDQEDLIRERAVGKSWSFTALRPEAVCGYATGNPMNLTMVIAVYAAISRELGLPLRFPGTEAAYRALYQVTSADILAEATAWAGREPTARNEIFNITNGDYFRWQHMWPKIARCFHLDVAEPVPTPLTTYMADKGPLWKRMTAKYGLKPIRYEDLVSWPFGDFIFNSGFDNISSTIKARRAGFHACIDTEDMFASFFEDLRAEKIISTDDQQERVALKRGFSRWQQVSCSRSAYPRRSEGATLACIASGRSPKMVRQIISRATKVVPTVALMAVLAPSIGAHADEPFATSAKFSLTYTFTTSTPASPVDVGGGMDLTVNRYLVTTVNDANHGFLHLTAGRCINIRFTDRKQQTINSNGYCNFKDRDGDVLYAEYTTSGPKPIKAITLTWTFKSGTGKYDGINGTARDFNSANLDEGDSYQAAGKMVGSYKIVRAGVNDANALVDPPEH